MIMHPAKTHDTQRSRSDGNHPMLSRLCEYQPSARASRWYLTILVAMLSSVSPLAAQTQLDASHELAEAFPLDALPSPADTLSISQFYVSAAIDLAVLDALPVITDALPPDLPPEAGFPLEAASNAAPRPTAGPQIGLYPAPLCALDPALLSAQSLPVLQACSTL